MQVVMNSGTASLAQAGPGFAALKFPGYVKAGDALTLTFESAVKTLHQIDVATWLDKPDNPVLFKVTMQARRHELSGHRHAEHSGDKDRRPHYQSNYQKVVE